jgi:hypothetical protein
VQQPVVQQPTVIQQPVVYTTPVSSASCYISSGQSNISRGSGTVLAWASSNAVSAVLSDGIGSVNTTGTLTVRPNSSTNYVLTVYGSDGRSSSCDVRVGVNGVRHTASVSLSQIPYTGFDYGTLGNSIYWVALALFALSAGYLVVYGTGIKAAFATVVRGYTPVRPVQFVAPTPVVATRTTGDNLVKDFINGVPRLVISRS